MPQIRRFLANEKGAVTIEFTVLVPFFILLMIFFVDTSVIYLSHSEMYSAARDIARRMSTGELNTPEQVRNYAGQNLFLGNRDYYVDPQFGSNMRVHIVVGIGEAGVFGFLYQPIVGKALVATAVMSREPQLVTGV